MDFVPSGCMSLTVTKKSVSCADELTKTVAETAPTTARCVVNGVESNTTTSERFSRKNWSAEPAYWIVPMAGKLLPPIIGAGSCGSYVNCTEPFDFGKVSLRIAP